MFSIWAYSLDMCVQACISLNKFYNKGATCAAVVFRADMGLVRYPSRLLGNCYLKTGCKTPTVGLLSPTVNSALVAVDDIVYATLEGGD
jgi:hypothetical protein